MDTHSTILGPTSKDSFIDMGNLSKLTHIKYAVQAMKRMNMIPGHTVMRQEIPAIQNIIQEVIEAAIIEDRKLRSNNERTKC